MEKYTVYTLEELLAELGKQKDIHFEVIEKMLTAYNSAIYPLDLMGLSVMNRSMSLIKGFIEMIRQKNFICAAPLVRMQLDNSLRFYAAFLVEDPQELARQFSLGKPVNKFTERGTKQRLTDRHLVNKLAEHYPWIIEVYEKTSGYIHLSDMHLMNVLGKKKEDEKLNFVASDQDHFITEKERAEATYLMVEITTIVLWIINSWALTKETPNIEEWIKKHGPGKGYAK